MIASVLIVSFNTREILRACLESLRMARNGLELEIIVVDNDSKDGSAEMIERDFPDVQLIPSQTNLGFAAGNNAGFRLARGEYLILVNPETIVAPNTLHNAIHQMQQNAKVGLAGGRLIGTDGHDQPAARLFPSLLNEILVTTGLAARYPQSRLFGRFDRTWANPAQDAEVDWVPGAFSIIRRAALQDNVIFDEQFFLYSEEVDLCRRLKNNGWKVMYWADLQIQHRGGESAKSMKDKDFNDKSAQLSLWSLRSSMLYYRKHHGGVGVWSFYQWHYRWQQLRALRAKRQGNQGKQAQAERSMELLRQVWHETQAGRFSPPRPWKLA